MYVIRRDCRETIQPLEIGNEWTAYRLCHGPRHPSLRGAVWIKLSEEHISFTQVYNFKHIGENWVFETATDLPCDNKVIKSQILFATSRRRDDIDHWGVGEIQFKWNQIPRHFCTFTYDYIDWEATAKKYSETKIVWSTNGF
jgi:hypothetical protein